MEPAAPNPPVLKDQSKDHIKRKEFLPLAPNVKRSESARKIDHQ
jgi:hypothetical protein